MFRRHRGPQRQPHPDPAMEAVLQRILTLQHEVARKEALLDRDHRDIRRLRDKVRRRTGSLSRYDWERHAANLQDEAEDLEDEIRDLHDEIKKRIAQLDPNDLSYL
jgi:hypothetical protein